MELEKFLLMQHELVLIAIAMIVLIAEISTENHKKWNIYPLTDVSQNNNFQNLSIYSNPSNGKFNIDFNQELDYLKVNVYDITGKKVFSKNYHNTSNIGIDLFNRNKGVYIIEIISEDIEIRRLLCLE